MDQKVDINHKKKLSGVEIFAHIVLMLLTLCAILPFELLIVCSLTEENSLILNGYSFFPKEWSTAAYTYLFSSQKDTILHGYFITVVSTVIGTAASLTITTMLAYVISRKEFPGRKVLNFLVFFTMLFSGGLVPTFLTYSSLGVRNTIFGLLVPGLLMKAFYVLLMKSYFMTNIPDSLIEAAKIDGAGTFRTFIQVVLPLSLPILATIGLFVAIDYWNDWYNGLIYLSDKNLFNINNILNRILMSIQYLQTTADSEAATALGSIPSTSVRMALAVVGVLPILVVYPFFQKYFVKGITIGAVKG